MLIFLYSYDDDLDEVDEEEPLEDVDELEVSIFITYARIIVRVISPFYSINSAVLFITAILNIFSLNHEQ